MLNEKQNGHPDHPNNGNGNANHPNNGIGNQQQNSAANHGNQHNPHLNTVESSTLQTASTNQEESQISSFGKEKEKFVIFVDGVKFEINDQFITFEELTQLVKSTLRIVGFGWSKGSEKGMLDANSPKLELANGMKFTANYGQTQS